MYHTLPINMNFHHFISIKYENKIIKVIEFFLEMKTYQHMF